MKRNRPKLLMRLIPLFYYFFLNFFLHVCLYVWYGVKGCLLAPGPLDIPTELRLLEAQSCIIHDLPEEMLRALGRGG